MNNIVYTIGGALLAAVIALTDTSQATDVNSVDGTPVAKTGTSKQETPPDVQEAIRVLSDVRSDVNQRQSASRDSQQSYFARTKAFFASGASSAAEVTVDDRQVKSDVRKDIASRKAHPTDPDVDTNQSYFTRLTSFFNSDAAPTDAKAPDSKPSGHDASAIKVFPDNGVVRLVNGMLEMQEPSPQQPVQPVQPMQPDGRGSLSELLGGNPSQPASLTSLGIAAVAKNEMTATSGQGQTMAATDSGGVLSQSNSVQNVTVQYRNPVSQDPYIHGLKGGQVYTQANGVYWTPARRDLDTMLSKIDPGMMQDMVVVPGPYGLRYGPGLAFIDVVRTPTPRYEDGFQSHFDTTGNVRSNGSQLYGRETVSGGSDDWGYRISYGDRGGSDYRAGNGAGVNQYIPAHYHNRDAWGELSFDLSSNRRLDFAYQRFDQTDTDYPCEMFNIDSLSTYGFEGRIVDTNPTAVWSKLVTEGWYNRTNFRGSTPLPDPNYPVINRVNQSLTDYFGTTSMLTGNTRGIAASSGARATMTLGDPDDAHINMGADFRYLQQVIDEEYDISRQGDSPVDFSTDMPYSWMRDPGVFAEWSTPVTDALTTSVGARADFLNTTARSVRAGSSLPGGNAYLKQDDILYAFYCTNSYKLNEHNTLTGSFGHAQRPPTLIERYADGLFISSLQSGFTRMTGDPRLNPERDWQIDLGLNVDYEKWRGHANCFQSWVLDYVTYEDESVIIPNPFTDARLLRYTNTPVATLSGFDLYGEYDMLPRITPFGRLAYVYGRDQTLGAPLPGISPMESTVGLRFHDTEKGQRWGFDVATRMVATQDQLGMIRMVGGSTVVEQRTPGFTTCYIRGYWNMRKNLRLIAGIDNIFNRAYQEHLDLRLSGPVGFNFPGTRVMQPGFSPYAGINWVY